jgi:hypothetical protein
MAGRSEYIVAHPNGETHVRKVKGGKVPTFATWFKRDGEWVLTGWSYQATAADAKKKALPEMRKYGWETTVSRVLPAGA